MRYFSTYISDEDILKAMSDIYLKGQWFEADITYSKGCEITFMWEKLY